MQIINQTYTYKYGKGKPLYVINGGPGLEHSYLRKFFLPFADDHEVVFYDQKGTGKAFDMNVHVTGNELIRQLVTLLESDDRRKDVVAHSWGTFLALAAIANRDVSRVIDKVILVNPFALDYGRYEQSGQRLLSRFPSNILEEVGALAAENTKESFLRMIQIIAPYYTHKPDKEYAFEFGTYNSCMDEEVYSSISGFNHIPLLSQFDCEVFVIKCDDDFISLDDTAELQNISKSYIVLSECGHFPFVEQNDTCYRSILEFLT